MDFTLKFIGDVEREIGSFGVNKTEIGKNLDLIAMDFAGELADVSPVGVSGQLKGGWTSASSARETNDGVSVGVSSMFYGEYQNYGTKPMTKMIPYKTLIPWVEVKLGVSPDEAPRVAYLVARKIKKTGLKAIGFVEEAWEKNKDDYAAMLVR